MVTIFLLLFSLIRPVQSEEIFDVTVMQQEWLQYGDYAYRTTLMLGNRAENLLLNHSTAFQNLIITDTTGKPVETAGNVPQLAYEGVVEDIPGSWVRIAIQDGLVDGIIDIGKERYYINSSRGLLPSRSQIRKALHAITSVDTLVYPPTPHRDLYDQNRKIREVVEIDINNDLANKPGAVTRVASIAIVVDNLYDEAHGGRGLNNAISTINSVDGLYREKFGLALKVEHAIIITDNETLNLANVPLEENLARFRDYRFGTDLLEPELSLVHLFTGATPSDDSVGLAYIGSACRTDGYDVSVSLPFRYPVLLTAHEIGHNLGALHDDETDLCKGSTDQLMYSHISATTTEDFSTCSKDAINQGLHYGSCLIDAIDAGLTLALEGTDTFTAVITNTDQYRAFPEMLLKVELKNTSIAAAPAFCEIEAATLLECAVPATEAGESFKLSFTLQPEGTDEKNIAATIEAIAFIDPQPVNNSAEIVIAATEETPDTLVIATNDDSGSSNTPPASAGSTGGGSGGGSVALQPLFVLLLVLGAISRSNHTRRKHWG